MIRDLVESGISRMDGSIGDPEKIVDAVTKMVEENAERIVREMMRNTRPVEDDTAFDSDG